LTLKQNYQMVTGTLKSGSGSAAIANGKLSGDQLSFSAGGVEYSGRVNGNAIEGVAKGGASWKATRVGK
jgi:hypothetical protein